MPNTYNTRIWSIVTAGETPFGTANVKIKGGVWTGGHAADTFTITDVSGNVYTWTYPANADSDVGFQELGWLSGPITFGGSFNGEINLYLGSK
jgi:hypothetical protein